MIKTIELNLCNLLKWHGMKNKINLEGQESSIVLAGVFAGLFIATLLMITMLAVNYFYPYSPTIPWKEIFTVDELLTIELSNGNFTRKKILFLGLIDNFTKIDSRPIDGLLSEAFFLASHGDMKILFQPSDEIKNFNIGDHVIATKDLLKIYVEVTDRNGNIINFSKSLVPEGTKGEVIDVIYCNATFGYSSYDDDFYYSPGWFYYVRFETTILNEKLYLKMWVGKDSLKLQK